jgi:hypothetical protein
LGTAGDNDFLLVSEFSVTGALYLPPGFGRLRQRPAAGGHRVEEARPSLSLAAFDENLTHYKAGIPQLFQFNTLLITSNGTSSCAGVALAALTAA